MRINTPDYALTTRYKICIRKLAEGSMTQARGRANKGRSGQAVPLPGAAKLTKMGELIRQSWVKLPDKVKREQWDYRFDKYKDAMEKI